MHESRTHCDEGASVVASCQKFLKNRLSRKEESVFITPEVILFERQLDAYQTLVDSIVAFDCLDDCSSEVVCSSVRDIISCFQRGTLYWDTATAKIFDERISLPWLLTGEFASAIERGDIQMLYLELRHRLNAEVLFSAREFFTAKFKSMYSVLETGHSGK